jgi:hypothetical protein
MGLDSYIYRTKKVQGLTAEDYEKVDNAVSNVNQKDFVSIEAVIPADEYNPAYAELNELVKERGTYIKWCSIFEYVGYLRKASAIHNFFVQECQDGIDECQVSMVSKEALEDLLDRCKRAMKLKKIYLNDSIIKDGDGIETFLPTKVGFFFGGTEFDEWYFQGVAKTKKLITKVLKDTDFDTQVILYRSSW